NHRVAPSVRSGIATRQTRNAEEGMARKSRSGAEKRTRTSTVLPPPGPEPGASTNSAISARKGAKCNGKALLCQRTVPVCTSDCLNENHQENHQIFRRENSRPRRFDARARA